MPVLLHHIGGRKVTSSRSKPNSDRPGSVMADPSLAEIAADLYAGPPAEFVAKRNARAKASDDRDLAAQIRALRKPSISAWVVNVFAQERAEQLGQALQLAEQLREAQADLDRTTLAKLSRERRTLTTRLAQEAAALATARGERVTESTLEAVRQTITAAFFDPDAATAVASGRLLRELEPSAEFPLDEIVAGGPPKKKPVAPRPADEVKARRERRDAERAVDAAEQDLARARRDQKKVDGEQHDAAARAERLADQVRALKSELAEVREKTKTADAELEGMADRTSAAAERVSTAEAAVSDARTALDAL